MRRRPMPAVGRDLAVGRAVALSLSLALLAASCGTSAPTPPAAGSPAAVTAAPPGATATPTPAEATPSTAAGSPAAGSPSASPVATPIPSFSVGGDITSPARDEASLRQDMRAEARIAEALGADGTAILAAEDEAVVAARRAALKAAFAEFGAPVTGMTVGSPKIAAPFLPAGPRAPALAAVGDNDWFEGIGYGATSVGLIGMFTAGAFGDAAQPTYTERSLPHESDATKRVGGVDERTIHKDLLTVGAGAGRVKLMMSADTTTIVTDAASGKEVSRHVSHSSGKLELNGCPSAEGLSDGAYEMLLDEQVGEAGRAIAGWSARASGTIRASDNDQAHLESTEVEFSLDLGAEGYGGGAWDSQGTERVVIGESTGRPAAPSGVTTSGSVPPLGDAARAMLRMLVAWHAYNLATEGEKFWRSGACIDMKATRESGEVKPSENVQFDVNPVGKFDSAPVKAPIVAAFSGTKSLEPVNTAVDPPATFRFTAGPNPNDKGTIDLTQTGKRGIGLKQLVFTVGGLDYWGQWKSTYTAGLIIRCSKSQPGFWAGDLLTKGGERPAISWQFPAGATNATATATVDVRSRDRTIQGWLQHAKGTISLDGPNPTFTLDYGEGHFVIKLKKEKYAFCK